MVAMSAAGLFFHTNLKSLDQNQWERKVSNAFSVDHTKHPWKFFLCLRREYLNFDDSFSELLQSKICGSRVQNEFSVPDREHS